MMVNVNCPRCGEIYVDKMFNINEPLENSKVNIINKYLGESEIAYCTKCWSKISVDTLQRARTELNELENYLAKNIDEIPIVSIQSPQGWEYSVISLVTGQSVTGTGVLSELTSVFTDLVGAQSGRYNAKIKDGEKLCFSQMRKQALEVGANAIIAIDVDYAEVGGNKGMLLVCATGTAVRLKNVEILDDSLNDKILQLSEKSQRASIIHKLLKA